MNTDLYEDQMIFSISDSRFSSYSYHEKDLVLSIYTYDGKKVIFTFFGVEYFLDRKYRTMDQFFLVKTKTSLLKEFLERKINKKNPEDQPYKVYQFIDYYKNPKIEIICIGYRYLCYKTSVLNATFEVKDRVSIKSTAPKEYQYFKEGRIIGCRFINNSEVSKQFLQPMNSMLYLVKFQDGKTFEVPSVYLEPV